MHTRTPEHGFTNFSFLFNDLFVKLYVYNFPKVINLQVFVQQRFIH